MFRRVRFVSIDVRFEIFSQQRIDLQGDEINGI